MDDTILYEVGKHIPGSAYRKDPLDAAFHLNRVWAQRRLQVSGTVADECGKVLMIPVALGDDHSAPRKPRKGSEAQKVQACKEQMKQPSGTGT